MSLTTSMEALFALPVAERLALADRLFASVPVEWQNETDRAWLEEAERRSQEMDLDPSAEMSPEEFFAGIEIRGTEA